MLSRKSDHRRVSTQENASLLGGKMSRRIALTVILIAALLAATTVFAQQRPYNQIMKDIQSTFASLKKSLDASGVAPGAPAAGGRGGGDDEAAAAGGRGGRGAPPANWDQAVRD